MFGYVGPLSDRDAFAETVRQSCGVWISKELASVFPEIASNAIQPSAHEAPAGLTDFGERQLKNIDHAAGQRGITQKV